MMKRIRLSGLETYDQEIECVNCGEPIIVKGEPMTPIYYKDSTTDKVFCINCRGQKINPITFEQALNLSHGDILYHVSHRNADGTAQRMTGNKFKDVPMCCGTPLKNNRCVVCHDDYTNNDRPKRERMPDCINPDLLLQTLHWFPLVQALKGEIDFNRLAAKELARRGMNKDGEWVGFGKAGEIHNIEKE